MSNSFVEIFTMRHGHAIRPYDNPDDPSLDPDKLARIEPVAAIIAAVLGSPGRIAVATSPLRRARQTADAVLRSHALASFRFQDEPEEAGFLTEHGLFTRAQSDRFAAYLSGIGQLARRALDGSEGHRAGLVLVTHDLVMADLAELQGNKEGSSVDCLGISRSTWSAEDGLLPA